MSHPLLEVDHLRVRVHRGHLWRRRAVEVLHGIAFSLDSHAITAFLGANGAGKTTTFRALLGLTPIVGGTMRHRGMEITPQQLRRHIGFLPELPYFYRDLTPRELLRHIGALSGLSPQACDRAITRWSEELAITAILDRPLRTCSKGETQRVGLIQAIIHRPELVILDEPMSGLDPVARNLVRRAILRVHAEGSAIIFSSHILADAEALCSRVIAISNGRIIHTGTLRETVQPSGDWEIRFRCAHTPVPPGDCRLRHEADGDWLLRGNRESLPLDRALQHLLNQSVTIIEARWRQQSLEEAFLHLIESSEPHRDGADHAA